MKVGSTVIIEKDFIRELIEKFYSSLMKDGDLCRHTTTTPVNDQYSDTIYQKIYTLRYYPAYYFEYSELAHTLYLSLFNKKYNSINIASLGCGLYPDYFALKHNLKNIDFHYDGYDCCEWSTRSLLPNIDINVSIFNQSVDKIIQEKINSYDVFIFPKSISDIGQKEGSIQTLGSKIANTSKNRVFFLNSFINGNLNHVSNHTKIFNVIHTKMLDSGFQVNESPTKTRFVGEFNDGQGQGLNAINSSFEYPQEFINRCSKKTAECGNCEVTKSPILKNTYTDYQVLEYNK